MIPDPDEDYEEPIGEQIDPETARELREQINSDQ